MFEGGKAVGYYNIAGGLVRLAGRRAEFSQAYFFNTDEALKTFRETKGFQARCRCVGGGRRLRRQRRAVDLDAAEAAGGGDLGPSRASWPASTIEGAKITETNP